jgi:hypothetical protein
VQVAGFFLMESMASRAENDQIQKSAPLKITRRAASGTGLRIHPRLASF